MCLLTKEIIEQSKAKFFNSTSNTLDISRSSADISSDDKIGEIRQMLPVNHSGCFLDKIDNTEEKVFERDVENKFVVNLFECRKSLRKKSVPKWPETDKIEIINDFVNDVYQEESNELYYTALDEHQSRVSMKTNNCIQYFIYTRKL